MSADVRESDGLLETTAANNNTTYGAGQYEDGESSPDSTKGNVSDGNGDAPQHKRPVGKRERLKRNPSLDKVDEEGEDQPGEPRRTSGCPYSFGVKSYLDHFYDTHFYRDPEIYEDDDDMRYLLHPFPRRRRCASVWWKVFVWIGANFLVFGIVGVLVGYLVPQRQIVVNTTEENVEVIDRKAINFNFNLNVCKLVGLILFCIGGLTLTVALLFPSFLYNYCEDDRKEKPFMVRAHSPQKPPKSPIEMTVPYTAKLSEVQPDRKTLESVVTQEGMVPYKD